ncbi:FAD-dependent monooxygenase [Streptomyces sp. NBC_01795]|uniref:FAD-dependent monooxygenase n=1 Tax=unclassified Streptomyces TaxID=2593676 RepID=UPI002DDB2914|nr:MULTISPECIES: FAD-dependent monooxygenase [unclassified Streptomyces]WSA93125.1 FAD-dependent monooxygenase [Streptomyces sp. NBC_01795]WSS14239.1 FAD-dependent monooxygenase [Streptomyces sp. NBC_01186]
MARTSTTQETHGAGKQEAEVLVVGAGPTGLLLAGDLAASGRRVTLIERRDDTAGNLTRALVVHARTLEQLDARGLADELVKAGHPVEGLRLFGTATLDPTSLPTRFPFVLVVGQYEVERLLERRAREAGVVFRHGAELAALRQDAHGVEADIREGGKARTLRARYLVGADGVHSKVREELGLPFPGKSVLRSIVLADVRLAEPPKAPFTVNATERAFALVATFGDGWYRVMGWRRGRQLPDSAPAELEEVREFTRLALGSDFGMHDARWISRFHSDERQAPAYRVGRVFLAGDAAHVHSPAGGMGMNTGLQDAANLSWKLTAVLDDTSASTLLDTYEAERHPVGKVVLRTSGAIIRVALMHFPGSHTLRTVAGSLVNRIRPMAKRAIMTVSGIGLSYPARPGSHRLAGRRAPDLALASGRLYETLREGRFVLVTPHGAPSRAEDPRFVHEESAGAGRHTLLIRPDGYIAWAGEGPAPEGLEAALTEWTGWPT